MTPAPLTRQIAEFAAGMAARGTPAAALPWVRIGFSDCVAVILAGIGEPVTQVLLRVARAEGGIAESRVCLGGERFPAAVAALVNAAAAHALDWDDYAFSNHPSAVLVPTVLAAGEAAGGDGRRMAAAYVAGYEVWAALMAREPDHLHSKGWHPTGVFGPIAAAAAAAVMFGLDAERAQHAIGLAASHAGGVMANFGTMTKPYHGGRAAQTGIQVARLALAGMTAGPEAIESAIGLLHALSPKGAADRTTPFDRLGHDWAIERLGLNVKKHPTVGASQRSIDAILGLRARASIDPARVARIIPRVSVKHAAVMPFHRPETALQAKFSLEFVAAAALIAGRVTPVEVDDVFVQRSDVRAMMERVEIATTTEEEAGYPGAAPFDFVRIMLDDGSELVSENVHRATGHASRPLEPGALWEKFVGCAASAGCTNADAHRLFDLLQRIETLPGANALPAVM